MFVKLINNYFCIFRSTKRPGLLRLGEEVSSSLHVAIFQDYHVSVCCMEQGLVYKFIRPRIEKISGFKLKRVPLDREGWSFLITKLYIILVLCYKIFYSIWKKVERFGEFIVIVNPCLYVAISLLNLFGNVLNVTTWTGKSHEKDGRKRKM